MRFTVRHHTWYRYDAPVRLAAHVLRLTPRPDQGRMHGHRLRVVPRPLRQRAVEDVHGNRLLQLEFGGRCQELRVESEFELETIRPPALTTAMPALPWRVGATATLDERGAVPVAASVRRFAEALAREVDHAPLPFLDHLARTLYLRFDRRVRHAGDASPAEETLARGRGACRDLAVLFMDAARSLGMASRFVSGYQAHAERADGRRHLHAWPEVRLPGVGFRGWDPTHGCRVADGHVALCAAPTQAETMPIEGAFFVDGPAVRSTLEFSLRIETRDDGPPEGATLATE